MLARVRSAQLSTMLERQKGKFVFWANRPVDVPSYPAVSSRSAVRQPTPTQPWCVLVLGSILFSIPGHALHKNNLQKYNGSLVCSQKRKAAVVPWVIGRFSTGFQPLVNRLWCSPIGLNRVSFVRASEESFKTVVVAREKLSNRGSKTDSEFRVGN